VQHCHDAAVHTFAAQQVRWRQDAAQQAKAPREYRSHSARVIDCKQRFGAAPIAAKRRRNKRSRRPQTQRDRRHSVAAMHAAQRNRAATQCIDSATPGCIRIAQRRRQADEVQRATRVASDNAALRACNGCTEHARSSKLLATAARCAAAVVGVQLRARTRCHDRAAALQRRNRQPVTLRTRQEQKHILTHTLCSAEAHTVAMRATRFGDNAAVGHTHCHQVAHIGAHKKQRTTVTHAQIRNAATAIVAERLGAVCAGGIADESRHPAARKADKQRGAPRTDAHS
jgi:hypothetical protein